MSVQSTSMPFNKTLPVKAAEVPADSLMKKWSKRVAPMVLDMGEASREEGFRLNGSR